MAFDHNERKTRPEEGPTLIQSSPRSVSCTASSETRISTEQRTP